jgi:hypothetical protein
MSWRSAAQSPSIATNVASAKLDLDTQVLTAGFAERPKHIDIIPRPVLRTTEIPVREVVGFDDVLHDLLCARDDIGGGEEPQSPDA